MAVKAKKAKEVKEVKDAPVAVPQNVPQATTVVGGLDDALAMLEGANVSAAPAKAKKSSVPDVKVDGIDEKVLKYVVEASREAAAKGRKEAIGAELRPVFDDKWLDWCRANKSFAPRINVNTLIAYTGGQLKVADPDDVHPIKAINDALKSHFGAEYGDFVKPSLSLYVKDEESLAAAGLTLAGVIKTLQEKLGAEEFSKMFGHEQGIALKKVKMGKDDVVVLRQRAAMDASVAAKVKSAMDKGLLARTNGALTPSTEAKLNAEKMLAALEKEKAAKVPAVQVNVRA